MAPKRQKKAKFQIKSRGVVIRDRIKELRRVKASELKPHPGNWRTHSDAQRDALKGLLSEVGYAVPALAMELPDGTLQLIDGHLRAETLPDAEIPVAILDVTEEEAKKLLVSVDPLSALAGQDDAKLIALLQTVESDSAAVQKMLSDLIDPDAYGPLEPPEFNSALKFQILIDCVDEGEQAKLMEKLQADGLSCRALML